MEKLQPILRFPEFLCDWNHFLGNELFNSVTNKNHNSDLPVLAISQEYGAIPRHLIDYKVSVTDKSLESYKIVEVGDFIISLRSFQGGIEYSTYKGICSPAYIILKPIVEIERLFYKYYFKTDKYIIELNKKLEGIRDGKMVSFKYFSEIEIPFPSLPEQQKIASFLSTVDEKIQLLKKQLALLEQYKKGVMQKIFSREIRFKDEDGREFPDWEEKKLGEVSQITTGASNRIDSNLYGEYTFFDRSQDIRSSNRFLFDTEAIIVPGEGKEFIPKYFVGKFDLHQRTYAIMNFEPNFGEFLYYFIGYNSNHLNSQAVGSTVKSLRLPMFEKMPIRLPSLPEQQKIASFLSAIDDKIDKNKEQILKMELWKKGLLQQMFV